MDGRWKQGGMDRWVMNEWREWGGMAGDGGRLSVLWEAPFAVSTTPYCEAHTYPYTHSHPYTLPQYLPSLKSFQCGQGGRKDLDGFWFSPRSGDLS